MTVRKILVASALSLCLAAPAYAGVLGIGGSGGADIGLDDEAARTGLGLGGRAKADMGGAKVGAGASVGADANVATPDVSGAATSTEASGRAGGDAAASSAHIVAVRASEKLQSLGYSSVRLASGADVKAGSDLKFAAVNPKGENVVVTMDSETNAIVSEESRL